MSRVVSSKHGDRQLVELPPINYDTRSAAPSGIAEDYYSYGRTYRDNINEGYFPAVLPRKHAYNSGIQQRDVDAAPRPFTHGSTVTIKEVYRPSAEHFNLVQPVVGQSGTYLEFAPQAMGREQSVQRHYSPQAQFQPQWSQQAPIQQPYVSQAHGQPSYVPQNQVLVTQADSSSQPEQSGQIVPYKGPPPAQSGSATSNHGAPGYGNNPNEKHIFYGPDGKVLPGPPPWVQIPGVWTQADSSGQPEQSGQIVPYKGPPQAAAPLAQPGTATSNHGAPVYGNNPNEKHIFYGADGKVLPGPPAGAQIPRVGSDINQQDFLVDAVLENGHVKSVSVTDDSVQFPKLPEYLLRHLQQKYGQFERTDARILYKGGQFHVHAVPKLPGTDQMLRLPPPFDHLSERHRYGTPPPLRSQYGLPDGML